MIGKYQKKHNCSFKRKKNNTKHLTQKSKDWNNYHIVDFNDLYQGTAKREDCAKELNMRVEFSKKYMHGKYDKVHLNVNKKLSENFTTYDKLNLTLDALCVIYKGKHK